MCKLLTNRDLPRCERGARQEVRQCPCGVLRREAAASCGCGISAPPRSFGTNSKGQKRGWVSRVRRASPLPAFGATLLIVMFPPAQMYATAHIRRCAPYWSPSYSYSGYYYQNRLMDSITAGAMPCSAAKRIMIGWSGPVSTSQYKRTTGWTCRQASQSAFPVVAFCRRGRTLINEKYVKDRKLGRVAPPIQNSYGCSDVDDGGYGTATEINVTDWPSRDCASATRLVKTFMESPLCATPPPSVFGPSEPFCAISVAYVEAGDAPSDSFLCGGMIEAADVVTCMSATVEDREVTFTIL